jgi:plastocyanin
MRSLLFPAALTALCLVLPGWTPPEGDPARPPAEAARAQAPAPAGRDVRLYDKYYSPSLLYVAPGTTVRWVNSGSHVHTVTSGDGRWDSGDLAPGAEFRLMFPQRGTYSYYCRHHAGMKGQVVVE